MSESGIKGLRFLITTRPKLVRKRASRGCLTVELEAQPLYRPWSSAEVLWERQLYL